jgi:signal transduction histidine kinase
VGANGQRIYTVIMRDITGRQTLEDERERFYRAIADANRTKDEFIATLSHELTTPLNVMLGWIWRLRHSRSDPETIRRGIEVIERNTRAQQRLIDDLRARSHGLHDRRSALLLCVSASGEHLEALADDLGWASLGTQRGHDLILTRRQVLQQHRARPRCLLTL